MDRDSPLIVAVESGDLPKANAMDSDSPLMVAVQSGDLPKAPDNSHCCCKSRGGPSTMGLCPPKTLQTKS